MAQRILLIDDDDSHRLLARRALKDLTTEFVEAGTPEEGRAAFQSTSATFALVILDMNLNGVSSLELLRNFRISAALDDLPIVVLSTSALEKDVSAAYGAGASAYLLKSTDPAEFRSTLARAAQFFLRSR